MGDPNTDAGSLTAAVQTDDSEQAGSLDASEEIETAADRCDTCGTTIGPRAYRLTRVVSNDHGTLETHYCSEACLPDEPTRATAEGGDDVQDWSYCR